jgi:cation diffusion facilitator CzcD-associated flavoprotein CzcO
MLRFPMPEVAIAARRSARHVREDKLPESTDVAIIGAGPAGLATAACLRKAGLDFVILEKEQQVATSWRKHYERLHLHTVKRFSALPFMPFPKDYPRYVPRASAVAYFEAYAQSFDLQPRFGQEVQAVRRDAGRWTIESTSATIEAPFLVVASGFNAEPVMPALPGLARFKGKAVHAADYANAGPFTGQSVLVVGMGNTGAEIALDLAEGGARPTISIRDGAHVVPRELFGIPIQIVGMIATKSLPNRVNDAIFPPILDMVLGNPPKYGIRRPKQGILARAALAKIPVIDVGTVRKVAEGAIAVAPAIAEIVEDGAVFEDGSKRGFGAIVFATGYRAGYHNFLAVADTQGADGGPNLFFIGFRNSITGLLREISREAIEAADSICRTRGIGATSH